MVAAFEGKQEPTTKTTISEDKSTKSCFCSEWVQRDKSTRRRRRSDKEEEPAKQPHLTASVKESRRIEQSTVKEHKPASQVTRTCLRYSKSDCGSRSFPFCSANIGTGLIVWEVLVVVVDDAAILLAVSNQYRCFLWTRREKPSRELTSALLCSTKRGHQPALGQEL